MGSWMVRLCAWTKLLAVFPNSASCSFVPYESRVFWRMNVVCSVLSPDSPFWSQSLSKTEVRGASLRCNPHCVCNSSVFVHLTQPFRLHFSNFMGHSDVISIIFLKYIVFSTWASGFLWRFGLLEQKVFGWLLLLHPSGATSTKQPSALKQKERRWKYQEGEESYHSATSTYGWTIN